MGQHDKLSLWALFLAQQIILLPFCSKFLITTKGIAGPIVLAVHIAGHRPPKANQVQPFTQLYLLMMQVIKPLNFVGAIEEEFAIMITRHKEYFTIKNIFNRFVSIDSFLEHFFLIMVQFIMIAICCISSDKAIIEFRLRIVVSICPLRQLFYAPRVEVDICHECYFQSFCFVQHFCSTYFWDEFGYYKHCIC